MKQLTLLSAVLLSSAALADPADPQIYNVRLEQDALTRRVTVMYNLDETAVVTMDVLTNGVSIGGANIQNVGGDCFKKIAAGSNHVVTWDPLLSWPDQKFGAGVVSVRMTAWALDNTPDYMVVDISDAAQPDTQTYYPDAYFVPGGVSNSLYKTTKLVMRKIMAKGVEWTMGSTKLEKNQRFPEREETHQVTLTNNYYIGVYAVTQSQWKQVATNNTSAANFTAEPFMRPMEKVCYNEIRNAANTSTANTSYNWPADPNPSSFLGLLRSKTGIDFDLPSEAQWEFAARAGHGVGYWNDGSAILNSHPDPDSNLNNLGRYTGNNPGGKATTSTLAPSEGGTDIVGSYLPNSWGLYDMHGNVWEWCLDWYQDNIGDYNGRVNIDPSNAAKFLSGESVPSDAKRVKRGGSYALEVGYSRPAFRLYDQPNFRGNDLGLRVVCTAGLQ